MKNQVPNHSDLVQSKPSKRDDLVNKATCPAPDAPVAKRQSKQQLLANLLLSESGATLDQMVAATGWLPHTTRAALTGLKKKGYELSSDKVDGVRTYRAVAPQ